MKYETVAINSITLTTGLMFAVDTDCKVRVEVYITNMRMFCNMYDSNIYIQRVASVFFADSTAENNLVRKLFCMF